MHSLLVIIFFILFWNLSKLLIFTYNALKIWNCYKNLPGPEVTSVWTGNFQSLFCSHEQRFKNFRSWGKKYNPVYMLRIGPFPAINLVGPDEIEDIISSSRNMSKGYAYEIFKSWLKEGLLTSTGSKWLTRRKTLTPAFHFSILHNFIKIFNSETNKLVDQIKEESSTIDIVPYIGQMTLNAVIETAMGSKLNTKSQEGLIYKNSVLETGQIYLYRIIRPWLYIDFIYWFTPTGFKERKNINLLHNFTRKIISERMEYFNLSSQKETNNVYRRKAKLAMLDLLLNAKSQGFIDEEGIAEEVDTFMFEGHDTTSMGLSFAIMLLACNRNVQDKVYLEMEEVLGDTLKNPTYEDLQKLQYMECCIKESLRLYPSVPYIGRCMSETVTTKSGYTIPKNGFVNIHIFDLHRNPKYFPNPEKFDPDRFLPENCVNRHPFSYLPFSGGPRNCIGQKFALLEMKAVLCGILGNFILEPVDTPETIVLIQDMVLRPREGIKVKFLTRT